MKTLIGFGDLALIFKVTAELSRSNLSLCGWRLTVFSETILFDYYYYYYYVTAFFCYSYTIIFHALDILYISLTNRDKSYLIHVTVILS